MYVWKKHHHDLPLKRERRIPLVYFIRDTERQCEVSGEKVIRGLCGRFPSFPGRGGDGW